MSYNECIMSDSLSDSFYRINISALWKENSRRTGPDHAAIIIYRGMNVNSKYRMSYLRKKLELAFPVVHRNIRLSNGAYPQYALWSVLTDIHKSIIYSSFTDEEKDWCDSYINKIKPCTKYGSVAYGCVLFDNAV